MKSIDPKCGVLYFQELVKEGVLTNERENNDDDSLALSFGSSINFSGEINLIY